MDYCLSFVLFLKTISLSVLGSIFGIFKLFLHTIHLIIYTICIDKWKEKQKVTYSIFPTTIRYTTLFPSLLFIHCITPRFGRSIWISTVVAIFSYFFYIHDDVVQIWPILDRQYQMLFFLSFLCNCYHFLCVYSHLINHKVLLIIRVD